MITLLKGGRLLDCVGDEPREAAAVVVEDGLIKEVAEGDVHPPDQAQVVDVRGMTILPGLTDAHQHSAIPYMDMLKAFTAPVLLTALAMKDGLERTLQGGFTTVAEMGFGNLTLKRALEDGAIKGPRMLLACGMLSKTGGHADFMSMEGVIIKDTGLLSFPRLCDGVAECLKAVREQFRAGADHIKVMATGGGASPYDTPFDSGFREDELRAIVEESREMGRPVRAHCLNDEGLKRAVKCGVTAVEHGFFMSQESAAEMKRRGTFLVPTITVLQMIKKHGREWGAAEHLERKTSEIDALGAQMAATELGHRIGLKIASASDAWAKMRGMEGWEIKFKTECGFSPYEAVKSATKVNAELFGLADKMGTLEPGKWADLIVVDGRPEEDGGLFCDPDKVRLVMKGGRICKNTI